MSMNTDQLQAHSELDISTRLTQLQTRISGRAQLGLHSRSTRYGLRRDLNQPIERPSAKIPIAVRRLVKADLPVLLPAGASHTDARERLEIAWRRAFAEKAVNGCFVAVDLRDGTPCYMQWLFSAADNGFIRQLGGFPELKWQEALLENAYTPVKYRGMGIMAAAMALIAERAADFGARYVLTFVDEGNIASLKGCQRAGFHPHLLHQRVQFGFGMVKRDSFEPVPDGDPRRTLRF